MNGTDVTSSAGAVDADGFLRHEGCPARGSITFTATNLQAGANFLAIQAAIGAGRRSSTSPWIPAERLSLGGGGR